MKSYVFIAMVICSIIIYPFEAKSQDSGDLRIKSVTLVDGTVISAQNYAATDAAATDELQVKSVEFTDGTIIEADHFEILDQNMKKTGNDNDKSNTDGTARSGKSYSSNSFRITSLRINWREYLLGVGSRLWSYAPCSRSEYLGEDHS